MLRIRLRRLSAGARQKTGLAPASSTSCKPTVQLKRYGLSVLAASLCLTGCVNMAMTGASAAFDRYDIQRNIENHRLSTQVKAKIHEADNVAMQHVSATTFNHWVLLTGQVPNQKARQEAENKLKKMPKVTRVINQLEVRPPLSPWQHTQDSWLTTKIRTQFLFAKNVDPQALKVITENSQVYLLGAVSRRQANAAATIARQTAGVKKVVKALQYFQWVQASRLAKPKSNTPQPTAQG